ncbi:hypothetical protein BDW75DRAFT_225816 [Aspergillus navahoensis]
METLLTYRTYPFNLINRSSIALFCFLAFFGINKPSPREDTTESQDRSRNTNQVVALISIDLLADSRKRSRP